MGRLPFNIVFATFLQFRTVQYKAIKISNVIYQKRFLLDKEMLSYSNLNEEQVQNIIIQVLGSDD